MRGTPDHAEWHLHQHTVTANSLSIKPKCKTATWFEDLCCPVKLTFVACIEGARLHLANACADGAALRTLRRRHDVHYSTASFGLSPIYSSSCSGQPALIPHIRSNPMGSFVLALYSCIMSCCIKHISPYHCHALQAMSSVTI